MNNLIAVALIEGRTPVSVSAIDTEHSEAPVHGWSLHKDSREVTWFVNRRAVFETNVFGDDRVPDDELGKSLEWFLNRFPGSEAVEIKYTEPQREAEVIGYLEAGEVEVPPLPRTKEDIIRVATRMVGAEYLGI